MGGNMTILLAWLQVAPGRSLSVTNDEATYTLTAIDAQTGRTYTVISRSLLRGATDLSNLVLSEGKNVDSHKSSY